MKIEAGKYYRLRNGKRVFVCSTNCPGDYPVVLWDDNGIVHVRRQDGKYPCYAVCMEDERDIASECSGMLEIPWDKLFPPWVRWFAVDEDGQQVGFELQPEWSDGVWVVTDCGYAVLPQSQRIPFTGNWKESLTERRDK